MDHEQRGTSRVRAYRPVRLHSTGSPHVVETLTKDLAIGGLRCVSPTLFPVSTEIGVELVLSEGGEPVTVRGRTAWFRAIPESEQFDIGITFVEVTHQSKRRLSAYLDRLLSQPAAIHA